MSLPCSQRRDAANADLAALVLSLTASESPRYLLLKGRDLDARKALSRLTKRPADSSEIDQECLDISMALEAEMALGKTSYIDCFRHGEARNGLRTWSEYGVRKRGRRVQAVC